MNRRHVQFLCLTALLLMITGCVSETTSGSTQTFAYDWWVPLSVIAGGIAAAPIGWVLRSKSERYGWGLLIAGPLFAVLGLFLFSERAVLDDSGFVTSRLFNKQEVKFDTLKMVRISSEVVTGRRGRRETKFFVTCTRTDGTTEKIGVTNAVLEAALPKFIEKVAQRDVQIINEL